MSELILGESLEVLIDHRGKTPNKLGGDFTSIGIPVASAMLVQDARLRLDEARHVSPEMYRRWMQVPTRRCDVLLTSEAPLGRVALVPDDNPLVLGQRLFGLRGKSGVLDSVFLFYTLQTEEVQKQLLSRATGTTVTGIRQSELTKIRINAPSYPEQRAIAEVLKALDDKIAINDGTAEISLELAMTKYEGLVSSGKFARSISMADCGQWLSGGTPKTSEESYWGGEIPWISAASLKTPWIDDSDRKITILGTQNGTRLVPNDTIIFVVRGMSLTTEFRIGLTQREVAFGQDCKALRPAVGIDAAVLFVAIKSRSPEILRLVDQAGHGTGRLATDRLANVTISLPGAAFNAEAAATLRPLVTVGAARQAENHNLRELRDALLPRLMSGEIRVRDAEKAFKDVT
jgi:type I restriction enzyme, S subunit